MLYVNQLWRFRSFILGSVRRELQARYRNSILGVSWVIFPALAQIIIYTLIFSKLIGARLPGSDDLMGYSIYLCAGIVAWSFHAELITRNTGVFLDNSNMIKKLLFPRICLPGIVAASSLLNFSIILALLLGFLSMTGRLPGLPIFSLVPLTVLLLVLSSSLGLALGVINVFFRDVGHLTQIVLQFWFWFTPIVYPVSILPEYVQRLVALNPMTAIVGAYQEVLLYQRWPDWGSLIGVLTLAIFLMLWSLLLYRRNAAEMVDEL